MIQRASNRPFSVVSHRKEIEHGWNEYNAKLQEWYGFTEAAGQDDIIIDAYNRQKEEAYTMSHQDPAVPRYGIPLQQPNPGIADGTEYGIPSYWN